MTVQMCNTFKCNIYLGLKEGYDGIQHSAEEVENTLQEYVNRVGLCVTITPTRYVYTDGQEDGVIIGLINYPRYPKYEDDLRALAMEIGRLVLNTFNQNRVTVEYPDMSLTLENDND